MAMEEDATTTRRLRVRTPKLTESLLEKNEKDASPLGQRLGSSSKRKAEVTLESLYLQKNYKDPSSTPLETIFESPRPSKGVQQGQASPDAALLMANRKLKRLCIFPSHHQLPRNKLKQRKERALKMKRLTGVQVPLGKAFSEDDVLAVLSCLAEEETAGPSLCQEQERKVVDLPNTSTPDLVEGMISVLSSLQMDSEPSHAPPNQAHEEAALAQPQPSKKKKQRRRCDLIPHVKAVSPSTPQASTSTHQSPSRSQPPKTTAWVKRLKQRSGLVFPQNSSSPPSPPGDPETATSIQPPHSYSRKEARPKGMGQNIFTETEQHTMSAKIPRLELGSKRTPDGTLATSTKKQCTYKTPQETNTDPSPPSQHGKGRGKAKKRRVPKVKHHSIPSQDTPTNNTLSSTIVPTSSEQDTASPVPQAPFLPLSPPLPTPSKRGLSPSLLSSLIACGGTADVDEGGERGVGKEGGTSPSSPSSRLAALSIHSSPVQLSPLIKPRKIRRRSARLSIGSDVIEGLQSVQNNSNGSSDIPLGTVWAAFSPQEHKADVNKAVNSGGGDPVPLPPSTATTKKKGQSKGRRRSNLYSQLEMMDAMRESAITTTTKSTSDVPDFSFQPISPAPVSLHSPTQVPASLTVVQSSLTTTLHHHGTPSTPSMEPTPHIEPPLSSSQPQMPSRKQDSIPNVLTLTTTPVKVGVMPSGSPQVMTEGAEELADLCVTGEVLGEAFNPITPHAGPSGFLSTPTPLRDVNTATHNILKGCPDLSSPFSAPTSSSVPASAPTLPQASLTQGAPPGENTTSSEGDSDSPDLSGILASKTMIHMGKVYYGPPALSPLSSSAPV